MKRNKDHMTSKKEIRKERKNEKKESKRERKQEEKGGRLIKIVVVFLTFTTALAVLIINYYQLLKIRSL